MKRFCIACITLIFACSVCQAHDKSRAEHYRKLYAKCDGKQLGKELFMITPDKLLAKIKLQEDILILDVRTDAESELLGFTSTKALAVPMNKVFQESTLSKLPKDKPIIVCCRLGARSAIVTMGLRDIGFNNVFNLKHGIKGTMDILTPKAANQ